MPDGASEGVGMYAVVMFLMVPVDVTVMVIACCVVVVDVALVWPTASNYQTTVYQIREISGKHSCPISITIILVGHP